MHLGFIFSIAWTYYEVIKETANQEANKGAYLPEEIVIL